MMLAARPSPALQSTVDFLTTIDLPWRWSPGASGFTEGVDIVDGTLLVCPTARPSALLHEAGHLAILPGQFRPLAQRNVSGVIDVMMESMDFSDPDAALPRAALHCSDPEATAWAWAAGRAIGLADDEIIMDDEYDHEGPFVRLSLQMNAYSGINGLSHAGFCVIRPGQLAVVRNLPAFPQLAFWLQKDFNTDTSHQADIPRPRA